MKVGKVIFAFVGVLIVLGSLGLAGAGVVALVAADDTDGFVTTGPVRITTDSPALVGDDIDIFVGRFHRLDGLAARIDVTSRNGEAVFVGIGPESEVDASGIDVDVSGAVRIPFMRTVGAGLLIAGLIGLALGSALTYLGVRSPRSVVTPTTPAREEISTR